jgi:hypothetical protein
MWWAGGGSARHGDTCYREPLHLATFSFLSFFLSDVNTYRKLWAPIAGALTVVFPGP